MIRLAPAFLGAALVGAFYLFAVLPALEAASDALEAVSAAHYTESAQ